ncbi:TIGR01777 family oxidoreductase [Leptospira sp. WS92.C1]
MKIGITGGTGLIGRTLALRLSETGRFVRIFTRSSDIPSIFRGKKNLELSQCDFPKTKDLEGLDCIVNLAGSPIAGLRWNLAVKNEIRSSRVNYTQNLVESLLKVAGTPPKIFLQGSAIGYYGSFNDDSAIFSEDSSVGSDFLALLCKDWETASQKISELGIRLVRLRTGIVLSPFGGALSSMLPSFRLGLGGPIGTGKQILSWIHIEDAVNSIIHIIERNDLSGFFNLVSPNPVRNEIFTESLSRILNRPAFLRVPAIILKGLFAEGADVILKGQYVVPTRLQNSQYSFLFPELETALRDLLIKK